MSVLDDDIRQELQSSIEQYFEQPERWVKDAKEQMRLLNLEPTLDAVIALFWGLTYGQIRNKIYEKKGRITNMEIQEIIHYAVQRFPQLKEMYESKGLF